MGWSPRGLRRMRSRRSGRGCSGVRRGGGGAASCGPCARPWTTRHYLQQFKQPEGHCCVGNTCTEIKHKGGAASCGPCALLWTITHIIGSVAKILKGITSWVRHGQRQYTRVHTRVYTRVYTRVCTRVYTSQGEHCLLQPPERKVPCMCIAHHRR